MRLRRMSHGVVLAGMIASALGLAAPRSAYACSAGADFNPAVEADVIIAGRVSDLGVAAWDEAGYVTLRVGFNVDRYVKGSGPTEISALDRGSVYPHSIPPGVTTFDQLAQLDPGRLGFDGSGGACGSLDSDPRGQYWVLGLTVRDGEYEMNRLLTFAIADEPEDRDIVDGIAHAEELMRGSAIKAPTTGNAGLAAAAAPGGLEPAAVAGAVAAVLFVLGVRLLDGRQA